MKIQRQKLIQRPYENGDERGLRLVKAILRPLMLRRTKDSTDKEGRPILVLPPADVQLVECDQSEAERDFYDALFKKSKVKFDQFVAQGRVLHNYASILELLLRLRQCWNHPFLVMRSLSSNFHWKEGVQPMSSLRTNISSYRVSVILQSLAAQGLTSSGGSGSSAGVDGGNSSGVSKAMVKDGLKIFNMYFEELHQRQSQWTVPDPELRESLRLAVAEVLLPAYRSFIKRFGPLVESGKNPQKYFRYTAEDLDRMLGDPKSCTSPNAVVKVRQQIVQHMDLWLSQCQGADSNSI